MQLYIKTNQFNEIIDVLHTVDLKGDPKFPSLNKLDRKLTLGPLDLFTKPISDNRSRNCILMSSIICKVTGDKKFSQQNDLSAPFLFASFHPSKALRRATWSLQ